MTWWAETFGDIPDPFAPTAFERYCPHRPTPKQAEFLALNELEALYGGAAGGGKSDALLMAALEYADVPGYAALILRRTYADLALPGAVMDRAKEWLIPRGVAWSDKDKRFTFTSGATLSFGYLDSEADRFRYQGAELQFIGVDEATQLPERWYTYLLSRLRRRTGVEVPLRARLASNPGGVGHEWVKARYVDAGAPWPFVPALLGDNPHIDAAAYRVSLAQLDPVTRQQLEEGLWIHDAGGLVYGSYSPQRNLIDEAPACARHILGIDYGFSNECAFTVIGYRPNDPCAYVLLSYKQQGMTPSDAADETKRLTKAFAFERIVADTEGLGKGYAEETIQRYGIPIEPAEKVNKRGYQLLLNGELANGKVRLLRGGTAPLVLEWGSLMWREDRRKEAEGANHCADATLYAWRAAWAFLEKPLAQKPPPGSREALQAEAERRTEARRERAREQNEVPWWKRKRR